MSNKDELLERYVDEFCKEFAYKNSDQAHEFYMSLMQIVRLTHKAAQEPYVREYHAYKDATLAFNALTPKPMRATDVCKIKGDY